MMLRPFGESRLGPMLRRRAGSIIVAGGLLGTCITAQAVLVTATFDLTSPTEVNHGSPYTFTADTGIMVTAGAGYDGVNVGWKNSVYTAPTGTGVVGDKWIDLEYAQRLVLYDWSKPGRLVGFTLQEDAERNGYGSSAQLFGGASGTTLIGTWNMANGQELVVDLSSYSGLGQANLFNFRTTVDVDSSFAVKALKWEYDDSVALVPEPSTVLAGALVLLPLGISALRSLRKSRAGTV